VLALIAVGVAAALPPILGAIPWLLSWLIPVFWLMAAGFLWRASKIAAATTLITGWLANMLWSFSPLAAWLGLANVPNAYVVLAVTLAAGIVTTLVFPGQKGFFRTSGDMVLKEAAG
jgi:SSS family solute:Na+ symporter